MTSKHSLWIPSLRRHVSFAPFTTNDQLALARAIANDPFGSYCDFTVTFRELINTHSDLNGDSLTILDKFAIGAQYASNDVCGTHQTAYFKCKCDTEHTHKLILNDMWTEVLPLINQHGTNSIEYRGARIEYMPLTIHDEIALTKQAGTPDAPFVENFTVRSFGYNAAVTSSNRDISIDIGQLPMQAVQQIRKSHAITHQLYHMECLKCKASSSLDFNYGTINAITVWLLGASIATVYNEIAALILGGFHNPYDMTPIERTLFLKILADRVESSKGKQ